MAYTLCGGGGAMKLYRDSKWMINNPYTELLFADISDIKMRRETWTLAMSEMCYVIGYTN